MKTDRSLPTTVRGLATGLVIAVLIAAATGCGTQTIPARAFANGIPEETTAPAVSQSHLEPAIPVPVQGSAAQPHPLETEARAAAAAHEGLTDDQATQLVLTLWQAVNWPSSAMGCQKPGYMYTTALEPGFRATYEHEGRTIVVHLGEDADSAFVPQGCLDDPVNAGYPREEPDQGSAAQPHPLETEARAAAAAHEGLTDDQATQLVLTLWQAVTWPSSAMGCQEPGYMYTTALEPGFRATYEHEGRTIVVHLGEDADSAFVPQGCLDDPVNAGYPREEPDQGSAAQPHPLETEARAAAAAHEGLTDDQATQLVLTLWQAVTWPSSAMGCQKPGYMYTTALEPGFRATYEHEGRTIVVHLGEDADSAFVPQGCLDDPVNAGYPREEPDQGSAAQPHPLETEARAAAAAHEGLTDDQATQLVLTLWQAVTWPSSAIGCQKPGYMYTTALEPGFRATYEHEGRTIVVHLGEDADSAFVPQGCLDDPVNAGYPRGE